MRVSARSDLYYRLNVFPLLLPPLRERRDDIPLLVSHFVEVFARRMGKSIGNIANETLDAFTSYSWLGTVHIRTMKKRARRALTEIARWCQEHRHDPVDQQPKTLNQKLRGHYQYYGRPTNYPRIWQ